MSLDIEQFNPTVAELTKLAESAKGLVITDHKDATQVALIHAKRIELKKARVAITNTGKTLREDAVAFQRKVIEKEKELIAIVSTEEDRLQALEDEVETKLEREKGLAMLPDKIARLKAVMGELMPTHVDGQTLEDFILGMSDEGWATYYNNRVQDKNEADRIALREKEEQVERDRLENERKQKEIDDEKERLAKEAKEKVEREEREAKEKKEAEELAEKQRLQKIKDDEEAAEKARLKAIQDKKDEDARIEKAKQDERDRIEREAKEKKEKEEAEAKELAKKNIFKKFMADLGYTEENADEYIIQNNNNVITVFKKAGTLDLS